MALESAAKPVRRGRAPPAISNTVAAVSSSCLLSAEGSNTAVPDSAASFVAILFSRSSCFLRSSSFKYKRVFEERAIYGEEMSPSKSIRRREYSTIKVSASSNLLCRPRAIASESFGDARKCSPAQIASLFTFTTRAFTILRFSSFIRSRRISSSVNLLLP